MFNEANSVENFIATAPPPLSRHPLSRRGEEVRRGMSIMTH